MNYLSEETCLIIASNKLDTHLKSLGKTKGGVSSYVLEMETANGQKYYFKQGNDNYLLQNRLWKVLKDQGLPLPTIIDATEEYMILKGVSGEAMNEIIDRKTKLEIAESFGEYLARLHKNETLGWGMLVDIDKGKYQSYLEFYSALLPHVDLDIREKVMKVLKETTRGYLNHGDAGSSHIFTNREGGFWGLIDFDDILSAPNLYDLAEFHGGIGDDIELWNRTMIGYCRVGKPIDAESLEFLVNEYLIQLDSWIWNRQRNKPELNANMQENAGNMKILIEKIKRVN